MASSRYSRYVACSFNIFASSSSETIRALDQFNRQRSIHVTPRCILRQMEMRAAVVLQEMRLRSSTEECHLERPMKDQSPSLVDMYWMRHWPEGRYCSDSVLVRSCSSLVFSFIGFPMISNKWRRFDDDEVNDSMRSVISSKTEMLVRFHCVTQSLLSRIWTISS